MMKASMSVGYALSTLIWAGPGALKSHAFLQALATFQNGITPGTGSRPVRFLRRAVGCTHWPSQTCGTKFQALSCSSRAIACCSSRLPATRPLVAQLLVLRRPTASRTRPCRRSPHGPPSAIGLLTALPLGAGDEEVPAALVGRRLDGAAVDDAAPVRRRHLHVDADGAQCARDQIGGVAHEVDVGRLHQQDRLARCSLTSAAAPWPWRGWARP